MIYAYESSNWKDFWIFNNETKLSQSNYYVLVKAHPDLVNPIKQNFDH